jgi:hypothetical protein
MEVNMDWSQLVPAGESLLLGLWEFCKPIALLKPIKCINYFKKQQ